MKYNIKKTIFYIKINIKVIKITKIGTSNTYRGITL